MRHPPYVAVVGPSDAGAELVEHARAAGEAIAAQGWVVVTGGLGGVMAAAAEGAAAQGGTVVGLLPGRERSAASPGHSIVLPTGLGELRNGLVVRVSDAVLGVGGSWGTQSELALAQRTGLPVVIVAGWRQPAPGPEEVADVAAAMAWLTARLPGPD